MTGSQGENETRVPIKIRNWFFNCEYLHNGKMVKLASNFIDNTAIKEHLVPNIRRIAQTGIEQGANGGDPDLRFMAAGLALCLCESRLYTEQYAKRFDELLDKCINLDKNPPQTFPLDQLILSLFQTESIKAIDAYLPMIAAYQSKSQRANWKCINYNVKNMDQLILENFLTDHPAFSGDWLPKVRILRKTLNKGIENFKSAYESERKQKQTIHKGFTAWACDWALAMQSSLAGARANSVSSTDFIDEVDRVRVQLSILQNPHRWIADIMAPCLDAATGTQKRQPETQVPVLPLEMPVKPVEPVISPIPPVQIPVAAEVQQTGVKDILDKLPGEIAGALKICANYVNRLIQAEEYSRLQREKSEEAFRNSVNAVKVEADMLRSKTNELETDRKTLAKEVEEIKQQINDTQKTLAKREQELTSLQVDAENQKNIAENLRRNAEELKSEKDELSKQYMIDKGDWDNRLKQQITSSSSTVHSRLAEAKSTIKNRIGADFQSIEQLISTVDNGSHLGEIWRIFAEKLRDELGIK
jgi:predicted  nucleic acid-binding Zn-ribbon protein